MKETFDVIVVGAGPVGLFAALRLVQQGAHVLVVEAGAELGTMSKASTFHPSTLDLLDEANVADDLLPQGVIVDEIQWRNLDDMVLARIPFSVLSGSTRFPYRLHAEQTLLTPILLGVLQTFDTADVRFSSRCTGIDQNRENVVGNIAGPAGAYTVAARFALAADGAHSEVREQLGIGFPGAAYASRALRIVTRDDLRDYLPHLAGITYVRDPAQSCSLLHMRDHWRLIFRVTGTDSKEELLAPEVLRQLIDRIAPGASIDFAEIYSNRAHVAEAYTSGRVALVGDAAHVTTTAGGMNLNCGLHDAYSMARAIAEVLDGAPISVFEDTAIERRNVIKDIIIPRTESRAAGSDGNAEALTSAVARISELAGDEQRSFDFVYQAAMLDTAPNLREPR